MLSISAILTFQVVRFYFIMLDYILNTSLQWSHLSLVFLLKYIKYGGKKMISVIHYSDLSKKGSIIITEELSKAFNTHS